YCHTRFALASSSDQGELVHRQIVAVATVVLLAGSAAAFDVTSCEQVVPPGEVAQLQVDLDCTTHADTSAAVTLASGAVLQMNGHSITQPDAPFYGIGVLCLGKCTVAGPGEISGNLVGILGRKMIVSDVQLHDLEAGLFGVRSFADQAHLGTIVATNVSVLRSEFIGIYAKMARLTNVTSDQNDLLGVQAARVVGTNVTTDLN